MAKDLVVATAEEEKSVLVNLSDMDGIGELAGEFGNFGQAKSASEVSLPFLGILQKGSPQVNKRDPKYLAGAEAGCLFNTLSSQIYCGDEGNIIRVVPIDHIVRFVEWVPREKGGGMVASHERKNPAARSDGVGRLVLPNGNYLNETYYQLVLDLETMSPIVMPFTSTNITVFRRWKGIGGMHRLNGRPTPAFFRMWQVGSEYRQNDKGDWFVYDIKDSGWNNRETIQQAAEFARVVQASGFEVGRPSEDLFDDSVQSSASSSTNASNMAGDDVPF